MLRTPEGQGWGAIQLAKERNAQILLQFLGVDPQRTELDLEME